MRRRHEPEAGRRSFAGVPARNGFTLIEMLIALLIFGMITAAGVTLLTLTVRTQETSERLLDALGALRRTGALLSADLAQAAPRLHRNRDGQPLAAFIGGNGEAGLVMGFVRRGWEDDSAFRSSLQRVEYRLRRRPARALALRRRRRGRPARRHAPARGCAPSAAALSGPRRQLARTLGPDRPGAAPGRGGIGQRQRAARAGSPALPRRERRGEAPDPREGAGRRPARGAPAGRGDRRDRGRDGGGSPPLAHRLPQCRRARSGAAVRRRGRAACFAHHRRPHPAEPRAHHARRRLERRDAHRAAARRRQRRRHRARRRQLLQRQQRRRRPARPPAGRAVPRASPSSSG